MAYTVTDITSKVQRRIKDTSYSSTEILDYLNDTQRDVFNEYRLPFMQTSQGYTLTTNVSDITNGTGLPANFAQAIDLTLTTAGTESTLPYLPYQVVNERYPDPTDTTVHPSNIPEYWYKFGETIRVFPTPNAAYTATLYYYKSPAELTLGADVPEIPPEFEEILVVGPAYRIMQIKDNYDIAGILENKYMELLDKLVAKYSLTQAGHSTQMRINRRTV